MKLNDFAYSLAIKANKEEDFGYVESLKFDILGYRASIIASLDDRTISELYYQTLNNFTIVSEEETKSIKIPKLLTFKDGSYKLTAVLRYGSKFKAISIVSEEKGIYIEARKFSKKQPFLIVSNDTLYTKNFDPTLIKHLSINGVFNNPIDVLNYSKTGKCSVVSKCTPDGDLDIEDSLYQKIVIFMYKQLGLIENQNQILTTES